MNKAISWVKNLRLRQFLAAFLVGLTVFVTQSFGSNDTLQARADVKSEAGIYYKGTPDGTDSINRDRTGNINDNKLGTDYKTTPDLKGTQSNNLIEQVKNNLQETAENIKEKLNLDEPLPESTKEFLNPNKDKV